MQFFSEGIEGKMERLSTQSQESSFLSINSQRNSSQSYTTTSKRSSQQCSISYNSQSSNSQQKLRTENNGSVFTQRISTLKSTSRRTKITTADPILLEKLVNVGGLNLPLNPIHCNAWLFFFTGTRIVVGGRERRTSRSA